MLCFYIYFCYNRSPFCFLSNKPSCIGELGCYLGVKCLPFFINILSSLYNLDRYVSILCYSMISPANGHNRFFEFHSLSERSPAWHIQFGWTTMLTFGTKMLSFCSVNVSFKLRWYSLALFGSDEHFGDLIARETLV